ncbi:MAG: hypothetical protein KAG66_19110, partial [Methylococcales bacterium]|nr:hypothetical protein [Methylococcales bacterium]
GSPEYRVSSSADREVSIEVLPEEGPSQIMAMPFDQLVPGRYVPGQPVEGRPHLAAALHGFEEAMSRHSCNTADVDGPYDACQDNGRGGYKNGFSDDVMPNPYAELIVRQVQDDLLELRLLFEAEDPNSPGEFLIHTEEWVKYRHRNSNYADECRYANKPCS